MPNLFGRQTVDGIALAAPAPAQQAMDEAAEEQRVIARARIGDEAACNWLLTRYRARTVRLAAQVLRNAEEAEDVAQEAFIRAFASLGRFRGRSRFTTWLYPIVVRLCLDRKRLARWTVEVSAPEQEPVDCHGPEGIDNRLLVEALLDRLSPPMRATLLLREMEGFEYDEIARALKIPVGTVRSRLNAARAQFRELWLAAMQEADNA